MSGRLQRVGLSVTACHASVRRANFLELLPGEVNNPKSCADPPRHPVLAARDLGFGLRPSAFIHFVEIEKRENVGSMAETVLLLVLL